MNVNSDNNLQEGDNTNQKHSKKTTTSKSSTTLYNNKHAPLAAPEDDSDDLAEYAQVKDVYGLDGVVGSGHAQHPSDPTLFSFMYDGSSPTSKSNSKMRHRRDKGPSNIRFSFFVSFISFRLFNF